MGNTKRVMFLKTFGRRDKKTRHTRYMTIKYYTLNFMTQLETIFKLKMVIIERLFFVESSQH